MSLVSRKKGKPSKPLDVISTITGNAIKTPVILCEAGHVEDKEWLGSNPPAFCPHNGCGKPLLPELHKIPTTSRFWKLLRLKVRKFREEHAGEMPVIQVKTEGSPVTRVVHYVFLDATTSMRWADGSITGYIPIPYLNPSRFECAKEIIKSLVILLDAQSKATKIPQQVILSIFGAGQPIQVFPNPRQDGDESPTINDVLDNVSASFSATALFDAMRSATETIEREAKSPENETVRYGALFVSDCNDTCSLEQNREAFEEWVKQTNQLQVITGIVNLSQNHGGDDNIGKKLLFQLDEHLRFYKVIGEQDNEDLAMEYWNKQKDLELFLDLTDYTRAINTCPDVPTHTPGAAGDDEVELVGVPV